MVKTSRRIPPTPVAAPWYGSTAEGWLCDSILNATAHPSGSRSTPAVAAAHCPTFGLARFEPQPVAVRALVDLDPVPFPGDQVVAALGALHVMRPALRVRRRLLRAGALLAQQLGVAPGEVFLFVAARLVGHRSPGVEGDLTVSVSPPGRAGPCGGVAAGEDDWPL